ncbi:MAG: ferritin family protein [Candidatus Scalindua sp.]
MKNKTVGAILKKAVKKKNESFLLYKNAANCVKDAHLKTVLNKFAEDELRHEQAIKNFNIDGLKKQKIEIEETSRQWISGYLNGRSLRDYSDFEDVLLYAVKREKIAFEFYSNMSRLINNPDLEKLFTWLAQEESKHKEDVEAFFWDAIYR